MPHPVDDEAASGIATPILGVDGLVVEGLLTTQSEDGSTHIAPMGPIADAEFRSLLLRPFPESHSCTNLRRTRRGVFHLTDDVELLARAAVGQLQPAPAATPVPAFSGHILVDACRWFAFEVESIDHSAHRLAMRCRIVKRGELRPFFGFNRAKHAVVEAAILATRISILPRDEIIARLARLGPLVEKTGAAAERRAFAFLQEYIERASADAAKARS